MIKIVTCNNKDGNCMYCGKLWKANRICIINDMIYCKPDGLVCIDCHKPITTTYQICQTVIDKCSNFMEAAIKYLAAGSPNVSDKTYGERIVICQTCEKNKENVCEACGCYLPLKAKWATEDCPLQKWPAMSLKVTSSIKSSCCNR